MDIVPLADSIIIKLNPERDHQKGSLFVPGTAMTNLREGKVVAVGPGSYVFGHLIPLDIKIGDEVWCNMLAPPGPQPILEEGEEYVMFRAGSIIAYRKSVREKNEI